MRVLQVYLGIVALVGSWLGAGAALAQSSGQVDALYQRADEYCVAGDFEQAIVFYTRVLELDAGHVNAYYTIEPVSMATSTTMTWRWPICYWRTYWHQNLPMHTVYLAGI